MVREFVLPSIASSLTEPRLSTPPLSQPSRRTFLANACIAGAAAAVLPRLLHARSPLSTLSDDLVPAHLLCSVAAPSSAAQGSHSVLLGLHTELSSRTAVALPSPRLHATHPTLPVVYIANDVEEHGGLPRGAVSAVRLDPATDTLHHLATEPLALFATRPERLAVSPDGRSLLVTAAHGGSLSLLPLLADGRPASVTHTLRLPGRGPKPTQLHSAPFAAAFHPSAPLAYVTDRGTDSLLVLSRTSSALALEHRHPLPPGFEPGDLTLSPDATSLWVCSRNSPVLLHLSLDRGSGLPSAAPHLSHLPGQAGGPLLCDPATGVVFVTTPHRGDTLLSRLETGPHRLAPTLRSTVPIPGLAQPWQLALLGPTLLVAGDPHLFALHVTKRAPQPPRNLLSNHHISGLSAVPFA